MCISLDDMRTQNIRFWQNQGGAAIWQTTCIKGQTLYFLGSVATGP